MASQKGQRSNVYFPLELVKALIFRADGTGRGGGGGGGGKVLGQIWLPQCDHLFPHSTSCLPLELVKE